MALALLLVGCSAEKYRQSADQEVYGILGKKEFALFQRTNEFTIDTPFAHRDPKSIEAGHIVGDRQSGEGGRLLTLDEALRLAIENNRTYQLRKENLYLAALTLTLDRHQFNQRPFGSLNLDALRESDRDFRLGGGERVGFTQLLKGGGNLSASLANDMLRYFTGDPRRSITTVATLNFTQPLLRGAGADVAAESLTQSERDVIYEVRNFALYQRTFANDIVTTYFRLLQRKDSVRNAYNNYIKLGKTRELLDALSFDRKSKFEVDQARQEELKGKSAYISAVEGYQTAIDQFKITLGLPLGIGVMLEDKFLDELRDSGLLAVESSEEAGFAAAVVAKMDLLNEIDRFEDSKRKIVVAANRLKANLTFVSSLEFKQDGADYTAFDVSRYQASAGLRLDLPFDRVSERNVYRRTLIDFERSLRSLALTLDAGRDAVRQGLRNLEQLKQNYAIQTNALALANRRVEVSDILLQAGRAQIRDRLEAQTALLQAQNAVTQVLVDYLVARMKFLVDVGNLKMTGAEGERWWLAPQPVPPPPADRRPPLLKPGEEVIPPDRIFGN